MNSCKRLMLFLLTAAIVLPAHAQTPTQTTQPANTLRDMSQLKIDAGISHQLSRKLCGHLEKFRKQHRCPGITLGFVLPDGKGGSICAGISNEKTQRHLVPSDRMFSGSIGKTYVAAIVLQLIEEGKFNLDTKLSHWFGNDPWFARLPNGNDLTLRMLLRHTSGLPRYIMVPEFAEKVKADPQHVWTPEERLSFVLGKEPQFEAGKGWGYSDTNYIIVGMIIERVTKQPYYDVLKRRILKPLGLDDTSPANQPKLSGLVSGYAGVPNLFSLPREVANNETYGINPQLEWTGGGLVCTSRDLANWARMLYRDRVFNDKARNCMLDAVETTQGPGKLYGIGVMIRDGVCGKVLGHAGWVPGYVSMMAYYEDHGFAIAVQTNTDVGMNLALFEVLTDELAQIVIDETGKQ